MSLAGMGEWEEMWVGGASMERCPLGTSERGQSHSRSCRATCQARCGAVRMECSEPRAWRYFLSHPLDFLLITDLQALLLFSKHKPPRVNILCPIPGLQSTGHDEFWLHE